MGKSLIVVKAEFDSDAGVWFVEHSDLPGLNAEAETLDALVEMLPSAVADLVEESGDRKEISDFSIELIAHASTRVHLGAA